MYDKENKLVEKALILNSYIPKKGILYPSVSQSSTWIDKEKYFTSAKANLDLQQYEIYTEPSKKSTTKNFVNTKRVCAFSMIQFCLESLVKLDQLVNGSQKLLKLWVLWDQYPFHKLMYNDLYGDFLDQGIITFEKVEMGSYFFNIELSGQILSLITDKNFRFEKLFWVAQGLSLILK